MELSLRFIGGAHSPAKIIELTAESTSSKITEDILDNNGKVNPEFITNLRNMADDLEEHNWTVDNE